MLDGTLLEIVEHLIADKMASAAISHASRSGTRKLLPFEAEVARRPRRFPPAGSGRASISSCDMTLAHKPKALHWKTPAKYTWYS
jgi:hypothetical protein